MNDGHGDTHSIRDYVVASGRSGRIDGALEAVAASLRERFDLWGAWLGAFISHAELEILSSWSAHGTFFTPGLRIGTGFTDSTRESGMTLMSGQPFVIHTAESNFGLVEELLKKDGIGVLAVIPLNDQGQVVAFLALASSLPEAIDTEDLPFLTGLGRRLETEIGPLLRSDGLAGGGA